MANQSAIPPPDIEWLKNLCYFMSIPSFAMLLKFFLELFKLGAGMHHGSTGGTVENEKKEQRAQNTEVSLLAVNSDVVDARRRLDAHDKQFEIINGKIEQHDKRLWDLNSGPK